MKAIKISFCLLFFSMLACKSDNKIYKKPIDAPIQTLNPRLSRFQNDYMIARNIFGQLLNYDTFGNIQPGLFNKWEISDDGKNYIFEINTNAKFHDGKAVTVDDVIFSIHYLAAKDSLISRYFANIKGHKEYTDYKATKLIGITKLCKYKIKIELSKCSYIFLSQLADPKIVILPDNLRNMSEDDFFKHPIGIGPYKFKSMSSDHKQITLEKFNDYHNSKSNIQTIEIKVLEKSDAINRFATGQIDDLETFNLTSNEINHLKDKSFFPTASPSINIMFFNGRKKILQNIDVRKEIANAISITDTSSPDTPRFIPNPSIIPHGLLGWSEKREPIDRIIPNQISPKNKSQTLRIIYYGQHIDSAIKQIIENIETKTRFSTEIHLQTESTIAQTLSKSDYDLFFENLAVRSPEPFNIFTFFDPQSPHNLTYFNDPVVSEKLAKIEEMVGGQRRTGYSELSHYIAHEKYYAIPVYTEIRVYAFSNKVKSKDGTPTTLSGRLSFEKVRL